MSIKSALRDLAFCVIWHDKHYVNQPPPVAFPPFGGASHQRGDLPRPPGQLACFPTPAGRLYGFRRQRRYKKWSRRRRTLPAQRYYITPEGGSPQPVREASAGPGQNPWRPGPKARRRHQPSPAKAGVNLREYSFPPPMSKRSLSPSQQRWLSGSHLPAAYRSRPVPVRTWLLPER